MCPRSADLSERGGFSAVPHAKSDASGAKRRVPLPGGCMSDGFGSSSTQKGRSTWGIPAELLDFPGG